MSFRKDRVRLVCIFKMPHMSAQYFESQFGNDSTKFSRIPVVQKNLLNFDITLANEGFDASLQSLGIPKSTLNVLVTLEAENLEKINEILREQAFQEIFKGAMDGGIFDPSTTYAFSGEVMTTNDK
ncbi:hypothetical protein GGX14DRAFT_698192 [Mycena pura]|uniref:Uncharacterized protein n=1 Tax=Mycena pura TaxID=153505 RepID=A0AAD6VAG8_9AGAR|nr:hypothetical protein GGX14DRAFT_698192 [Mycena pura]